MVEYLNCRESLRPHPGMIMTEKTELYRKVLRELIYGEIGAILAIIYLFGASLPTAFHLLQMWLNYASYTKVSHKAVILIGLLAFMELVMLFMHANLSAKLEIVSSESSLISNLYYMLAIWAACKVLLSFPICIEFKMALERQYQDDEY